MSKKIGKWKCFGEFSSHRSLIGSNGRALFDIFRLPRGGYAVHSSLLAGESSLVANVAELEEAKAICECLSNAAAKIHLDRMAARMARDTEKESRRHGN